MSLKEIAEYLAEDPLRVVGEGELRKKFPYMSRSAFYLHIRQLIRDGAIVRVDGWRIADFESLLKHSKENQDLEEVYDRTRRLPTVKRGPGEPDWTKIERPCQGHGRKRTKGRT